MAGSQRNLKPCEFKKPRAISPPSRAILPDGSLASETGLAFPEHLVLLKAHSIQLCLTNNNPFFVTCMLGFLPWKNRSGLVST
jgi:hypothetical protein